MEEKMYLKWYNKIGYGSGDVAGNVVYAFLTSFVMIYLTDTIGLMPGIVGTLIAASKLFDGVTDIFFGSMIDKTHSRLGKARPWMLYGYIGCAITLVAVFAVPTSFGDTAKYAWFFIAYTLLNGVFYTANNIAYSALTSLVTKNAKERVQMGSYRFIFAFATSLVIQSVTVGFVDKCGGGAAAWRTVAIIYAIIGFVVNGVNGVVNESAGTISIVLPYGTDLTSLKPVITLSGATSVSPASGETVNLSGPVTYTVTGEDGTTKTYKVTAVTSEQPKSDKLWESMLEQTGGSTDHTGKNTWWKKAKDMKKHNDYPKYW